MTIYQMLPHTNLPPTFAGHRRLHQLISAGHITHAGNKRLKIYGTLQCRSGKSMKRSNRVFFNSEQEAIALGYHPCGHCMKEQYKTWKSEVKGLK
jgi:hypothetical protein